MAGRTRLQIYNNALMLCGERALSALTETGKPRRILDQVWDTGGVRYCLEQAQWQFAMRTQRIDSDPSITPPFGYRKAFNKPDDWVMTSAVCSDEFFKVPLLEYADELENWFSDVDPIYVKFVSDDADYGSDLAIWPESFGEYVDAHFASRIIADLTSDKDRLARLFGRPGDTDGGELGRRLKVAKSRAAMTGATKFTAQGSWTSARQGYGRRGRDRGNTGSLIG